MTELATEWLGLLADWSLRWGVLILGLMIVFAVRSPRAVAVRLCLLRLVLVGGLLLPMAPRWWNVAMPMGPMGPMGPMAAIDEPIAAGDVWLPPRPIGPSEQAEPAVAPRQTMPWQMLVAGAWLAGCGFCLVRLAAGRWWLVRIRRAARPIGGDLLRDLAAVRDELGVRRPVEFLMSLGVAGPAVFGGWRPAVVVPTDWASLPAEDRRTALLHELAHVAHADDWAGLAEEFVRAGFFFHPLVHWLLGRLTREREQRCDTVVVRRGIAPQSLALVLLDSAKRLGPGRSMLAPAAAIPMFHQSSVKERIHQLLEADMTRWSKPLSKPWAALAALVVLGCCVGLGGFGATVAAPQVPPILPQAPPTPVVDLGDQPAATGPARPLHGTVSDKGGHPISGATILAVVDMGAGETVTTTSDAQGRFAFESFPPSQTAFPAVFLIALKDGYAAVGSYYGQSVMSPVALMLPATGVFRGVVKDAAGRPVAGAAIQAGYVHRGVHNGGNYGFFLYWPAAAIRGTPAERSCLTTSDASGSFEFTQLPAGGEIILRVTAKGLAELDTRSGSPKEREYILEADAKPAELVLQSEAVVRGRVTTQIGGLPPTATVQLEGVEGLSWLRRRVRPDADGRFTADGLPAGPISVALILPPDAQATALGQRVTTSFGKTSEVALELIPGVEVTGRVQVQGTREPVAGVEMETFGLVNPDAPLYGIKPTDADGLFRLRLPAGRVQLSVLNLPPGYNFANREHREIEIPADATTFRIPAPFELVKMKKD